MRRLFYFVFVVLLLTVSFLAGRLYNRQSGNRYVNNVARNVQEQIPTGQKFEEDLSSGFPGTVRIGREKQQLIGVKVGPVEKNPLSHTVRLLGRVAADETRIYVINATVDGWITKALANSTGSYVKKNEVLAAFYSPEFLSAVQALLYALGAMDKVKTTGKETPAQKDQIAQFNVNLQQYKDSLKNLGMGDIQIEKMIQTREWIENVDITSPANGFILVRNVSEGLRFVKGTEMYRIADLSHIWILADVYENEAQYFKSGIEAKVTLPYQKKTYRAKVSEVLPIFDAATRTLKIRLETDNPGFILRPDMFVDVELPIKLPPSITVPSDAVLDSGLKKTVFVDQGNGLFEPREVETGRRLGGRVEITKGLKPGEKIVLSGNFLIDSESRLELAAAGMVGVLSKDPVCGVDISVNKAEKAGRKVKLDNVTYYFCSDGCKEKFDKDPRGYLKDKP